MSEERLQLRINQIQAHLINFKKAGTESEANYQRSLRLISKPALQSVLKEAHIEAGRRRERSISRLERLLDEVQGQLSHLRGTMHH